MATQTTSNPNKKIFRYKFSNDINEMLSNFGRLYSYSNDEDFDKYWNEFLVNNDELISKEYERLKEQGYNGNINDKLYKSVKYYWIKIHKLDNNNDNNHNNHKSERNNETYITINIDLLNKINNYIDETLINNVSPNQSFNNFCKTYDEDINNEINKIKEKYNINNKDICKEKIKKCYKNKYYLKTHNK
tara:strand:- start:529 stop:1095 length:567 start_codon:yes stop_codon:yes gene_type:complete